MRIIPVVFVNGRQCQVSAPCLYYNFRETIVICAFFFAPFDICNHGAYKIIAGHPIWKRNIDANFFAAGHVVVHYEYDGVAV